jgi:hypothetical protein
MKYLGDDFHILGSKTGSCWCEPELVEMDGDNYWLHKDKNGKTILNDPNLAN